MSGKIEEMSNDTVVVQNTQTGETGEIRRRLFDSAVFNPDGLLVEVADTRSGCVSCGIQPSQTPEKEENQ